MSDLQQGSLETFRQTCADKLSGNATFSGIPVFTEKQKNIESEIETALGSLKCGICIIIIAPQANVTKPNLPGPYFGDVTLIARVVENVLINQGDQGTKKTASYLAEKIAHTLHHLVIDGKAVVCQKIQLVPDVANLIYDISFKTNFGL
jgi:hypothetical protein